MIHIAAVFAVVVDEWSDVAFVERVVGGIVVVLVDAVVGFESALELEVAFVLKPGSGL